MNWPRILAALWIASLPAVAAATNMGWPFGWTDPILIAAYKGASANDCETARKPVVRRLDFNGDGRAEALVRDNSECYREVGGHFTLVAQSNGKWRRIGYWDGPARLLKSRTEGWPDFEVPDLSRKGRCHVVYHFRGEHYYHDYLAETAPHQCRAWSAKRDGSSLQPARPRKR